MAIGMVMTWGCSSNSGGRFQDPAAGHEPEDALVRSALRVHQSAIVIDGHNDLPGELRTKSASGFDVIDIAQPQPSLHTDIPRLRAGGVGAQFWSAYVPVSTIESGGAARFALEQIDLIKRMAARYPDAFEMAYSAADVERIHRRGRIASLIGVEGGHAIENSLGALRMFYELGARYLTLTHTKSLDWADSCSDEPKSGGLSPFGEQVVRQMNRLGMLVDISHVSADTMRAVLRVSEAPVIASHSSAYALVPHPRNVPDDVLTLIAGNGGVVMVNFYPVFIAAEGGEFSKARTEARASLRARYEDEEAFKAAYDAWQRKHPEPAATIDTVVDHIDHIVKVAGVDHVGLGSDFDGVPSLPAGLEDVSKFPALTIELLRRGYTDADVRKILGGNLLRALREAERVAAELEG
ncbi:MAG: membrane dipeptidase [Phycisphaerales bacterium]|nr:MAG: membrane dipeptidase [Phycisphaerales bacterium]